MENDQGPGGEWVSGGHDDEIWPKSICCAKWDCFIIGSVDSVSCVVLIASLHKWTSGVLSTNPRCSSATIPISASLESGNMIVGWAVLIDSVVVLFLHRTRSLACSESSPEPGRRLINLATSRSPSHKLFCEIDRFLSRRWAKQHGQVSLKQTWECLLVEVSTANVVSLFVLRDLLKDVTQRSAGKLCFHVC